LKNGKLCASGNASKSAEAGADLQSALLSSGFVIQPYNTF